MGLGLFSRIGSLRRIAYATGAALAFGFSIGALADPVIKLGLTVPQSGAAATWGLGTEWAAKQAAKYVNDHGGVKVAGKVYKFSVTAYDNKYTAADGVKVARTMINRDGVKFIIVSIATEAIAAAQVISERSDVLLFTQSWSNAIKGPKYPLTFTLLNTPTEFLGPLYSVVMQNHPGIKTVVLISPNDTTDQEAATAAAAQWKKLGVKIVGNFFYERGTTQFQPLATRTVQSKPDAVDTLGAPPGDVGVLYRELWDQGWRGVKIASAGSDPDIVVKTGAQAVDGLYFGMGGAYGGPTSTPIQRRLEELGEPVLHEALTPADMSAWDGVMALKAAMEKSGSIDPRVVAQTLPTIIFNSSYGPAAFGGKAVYGSPQQILVPVVVTQIQHGRIAEVARVASDELRERLARAGLASVQ